MDVRVCPRCGTENKKSYISCSNCRTSLANVPVSQGEGDATSLDTTQRTAPAPAAAPPAVQAPSRPPAPPGVGSQQSPGYRSEPVKLGPGPLPIVIVCVVIAGLIAAAALMGNRKNHPPKPLVAADQVVISFLQAKKTRKFDKVKPYIDQESIDLVETSFSGRQAESAGITRKEVEEMLVFGVGPKFDELENATMTAQVVEDKEFDGETRALVRATVSPKFSGGLQIDLESEYVLVNEAGKWKVSLPESNRRMMKGGGLPNLVPR